MYLTAWIQILKSDSPEGIGTWVDFADFLWVKEIRFHFRKAMDRTKKKGNVFIGIHFGEESTLTYLYIDLSLQLKPILVVLHPFS